ncbi:MAG: hypothetical protein AAFR66_01280 [Bacteroidota bacterium]
MTLPKIKVSRISNLQDARYCAAEGVPFLSFSLERGFDRKLSVQTVWNINNWLEGPEIIIELNGVSVEEVQEAGQSMNIRYVSFPIEDWTDELWEVHDAIIIRVGGDLSLEIAQKLLEEAEEKGKELRFEIGLADLKEASKWEALYPKIFLNFPHVDNVETIINTNENYPFGISLNIEIEEEPGILDYDKTGKVFSLFQEKLEMLDD